MDKMMWFFSATSVCCIILSFNSVCPQSVQPRRDDEWPPQDFLDQLQPIRIACRQQIYVTDEAIKRFSDVEVHEDEQLKCYMNCLFHEFGMVDDAGEAHFEKILARLPDSMQPVAREMLHQCERPEGLDLCERAFWLHKCFKSVDPVHYFLM